MTGNTGFGIGGGDAFMVRSLDLVALNLSF
jgi:hypothetical protein